MISIIIPVYNVERYLNECLDSVCAQSFKDLEIICVNDGSTDNSLEILNDYGDNDNRIKIITQENNGLGHARNTGLRYATGEYVLFIDSDDLLTSNCLDELYVNAVSNDSDLVIFNFFRFNEYANSQTPSGLFLDNMFGDVDYNNFTFTYNDIKQHVMDEYFAVWFKLYKKEFLDKFNISFQEGIAYEDVLFQIKCFLYADRMSFLPEFIYNYRTSNSNSITSDNSKIWDIVEVADSVEDFLNEMSLKDYFKNEFAMFKIIHYNYRMELLVSEDYFDFVKNEFLSMKNDGNVNIEELSQRAKTIFYNVLSCENLEEYLELY